MALATPSRLEAPSARAPTPPKGARHSALEPWLRTQAVNAARHTAALRPFARGEFGTGPAAPSDAHLEAANALVVLLRRELFKLSGGVGEAVKAATYEPATAPLQRAVRKKARAHTWVRATERVWDFYFELFGQRQSRFGPWLLGSDRIALDCYQYVYLGLGEAKSIPAPPPFSYMRTGFSPATFRRGIPLQRLGRQLNPFPLIQLPYHRLVNPWTLGAVLHEVAHNLQNELGLARAVPQRLAKRLLAAGLPRGVAMTYTRWNREIFADLSGLLLGGPAVVGSLFDVIGRSPEMVLGFVPNKPHPTPYIRALLSVELLRRMGFEAEARAYKGLWTRLYPDPRAGTLPPELLQDLSQTCALVVDSLCYRPYRALGDRALAQVIRFERKEQTMIEEAARRLAAGTDPGVVPERFLIGAARGALELKLARPGVIAENFYRELARR